MKIIDFYDKAAIQLESGIISGLFEEQLFNKLSRYTYFIFLSKEHIFNNINIIKKNNINNVKNYKHINNKKSRNKTNDNSSNNNSMFYQIFQIKQKNIFFNYSYKFKKIYLPLFLFSVSILSIASPAYSYINLNQGSLGIGASGILNEATTWICYRLAPATLTLGLIKGFYDIKQHKPDAARKAFITAAAGTGVMLAPTITGAVLGIVQNAGGAANGVTIGSGNGSTTVGQP
jgi:hypothetical protein